MNVTHTESSRALYENLTLDEERALYGITHATVKNCTFDGPADGESALKEASDVTVEGCDFRLRYPFWHVRGGLVTGCTLTDTCRAALWYASDLTIEHSSLGGIKALRECQSMTLKGCEIRSAEFGWLCRDVELTDCKMQGEYPFFMTRGLHLKNLQLTGKYSFQYVEDCTVADSILDTKDAFWHAKNITVTDSTVKGEYLGWYSENLTLVRCRIEGTQPLCYCKNLTLIDCEMVGCDLAFENSTVTATLRGHVDSIKSPASGRIEADSVGEVVYERAPTDGYLFEIVARKEKMACPCCGYKTFSARGQYSICPVCFFEDDPAAYLVPDGYQDFSLTSLAEAQRNYKEFGACSRDMIPHVRAPREDEL